MTPPSGRRRCVTSSMTGTAGGERGDGVALGQDQCSASQSSGRHRAGPEILNVTRDMVRRGSDDVLDSFRAGLGAWRIWMDVCFEATDDAADLKELLQVT